MTVQERRTQRRTQREIKREIQRQGKWCGRVMGEKNVWTVRHILGNTFGVFFLQEVIQELVQHI